MNAGSLYERLELDFVKRGMSDSWAEYMGEVRNFITDNFRKRSIGLVTDNSREINHVFTAVFPSVKVIDQILKSGRTDCLLFVHHAATTVVVPGEDGEENNLEWLQMDTGQLEELKKRRISIYNLHVPLDNYGEYSTATALARRLGVNIKGVFGEYFGGLCGVYGSVDEKDVHSLRDRFQEVLGHRAGLYEYGQDEIKGRNTAIIGGGGNIGDLLEEIMELGINVLMTGITIKNNHSMEAHNYARENCISLIGGTHYSTEKFACIDMCRYFEEFGLSSVFVDEEPDLGEL
jgi:putative NIF3 family GTP cyclohydrolase 1 type 2